MQKNFLFRTGNFLIMAVFLEGYSNVGIFDTVNSLINRSPLYLLCRFLSRTRWSCGDRERSQGCNVSISLIQLVQASWWARIQCLNFIPSYVQSIFIVLSKLHLIFVKFSPSYMWTSDLRASFLIISKFTPTFLVWILFPVISELRSCKLHSYLYLNFISWFMWTSFLNASKVKS